MDGGTVGGKLLKTCILVSVLGLGPDPSRATALNGAVPSVGSGVEDWILKIQLNKGRYVMADAPSMAVDTSTTDQRAGSTSDQVGSYEDRDRPRSCGMR